VLDINRCAPLRNGALDLWHCDASGVYSGYTKAKLMGPPPGAPGPEGPPPFPTGDFDRGSRPAFFGRGPGGQPPHQKLTDDKTFFRGVQLTDDEGTAEFVTIFPGWYRGRAIHIHMKVWVNGSVADRRYAGGYTCHTGQLFFPEDISEDVSRLVPYREHNIQRLNTDDDHIFSEAGPNCIAKLSATNRRSLADGLIATAVIGVNPMINRSTGT
jgi:protocatechuate 3,4-dioxygenase beta subunit